MGNWVVTRIFIGQEEHIPHIFFDDALVKPKLLLISNKFVKRFFSDNFIFLWYFKLKLTWYVSQFFYVLRNEILVGSNKKWKVFHSYPMWKSKDNTLAKWAVFTIRGIWGTSMSSVVSNWKFVSDYIKSFDTYRESFGWKINYQSNRFVK